MSNINYNRKDFNALKNNLISLGYSVNCFETESEAVRYSGSQIDNQTVGFGGSMTLEEIRLMKV